MKDPSDIIAGRDKGLLDRLLLSEGTGPITGLSDLDLVREKDSSGILTGSMDVMDRC